MPLTPEEPQIHESAQGPRVTPAASRTAQTPRPVPGPRPAAVPRPGRPGPSPAAASRTGGAPRPAPPAQRAPLATSGPVAPTAPSVSAAVPQIQLIPASAEGALDAAEEAVDLLLDTGRAPGDILVLTTGDPHPWAAHELSFGEAAYWALHDAGDDVFYADAAQAERAAGRPVVVLAANGGPAGATATSLPTALARAGALLIVCGDPEQINSVLGTGV